MATYRSRALLAGICLFSLAFCVQRGFAKEEATDKEALEPTPAESVEHSLKSEPIDRAKSTAPDIYQESDEDFGGDIPVFSPPGRFWIRADYMQWWTSGMRIPALITTATGTGVTPVGALGNSTTEVLYGNSSILGGGRSNVRLTFGGWLDRCHRWGIEADYFSLGGLSTTYDTGTSTGTPMLFRPFYNTGSGTSVALQDAEIIAYPGASTGSATITADTYMDSAGAWLRYNLCEGCNGSDPGCGSCSPCETGCGSGDSCDPCSMRYCRTDLIAGYRYYTLGDNLGIHEELTDNARNHYSITDTFQTKNEFHGAELGLNTQLRRGRWSLDLLSKVALGNNTRTVSINGNTVFTNSTGESTTEAGGLLATRTNMGKYSSNSFAMIPQIGLELGYQLSCRTRVFVGYNLLYWGDVYRAGDQIDMNVDPSNLPSVVLPSSHFPQYQGASTSFWAQGINIGGEFRF